MRAGEQLHTTPQTLSGQIKQLEEWLGHDLFRKRGRGLELAWLEDPVEVYFLHIQGSGRIRLPDGRMMRVGYGGKNGHPYRSIGQEMIRRGSHTPDQLSAQEIKSWVRRSGSAGSAMCGGWMDARPAAAPCV